MNVATKMCSIALKHLQVSESTVIYRRASLLPMATARWRATPMSGTSSLRCSAACSRTSSLLQSAYLSLVMPTL